MLIDQEKWEKLDKEERITGFNSRFLLLSWKFKFISKFRKEDIVLDFLKLIFEFIEIKDYNELINLIQEKKLDKLNKIIKQDDQDFLLNHFLIMEDYTKLFNLFWFALGEIKTQEQVIELWHKKAKFLNLHNINFTVGDYVINFDDLDQFMINKIKKGFNQ